MQTKAASKLKLHLLRIPLLLFAAIVFLGSVAYAQGSASIVGTVIDPSGAVVPNASITITNQENGFIRTTVSNNAGAFSARDLPNGSYRLKAEAQGFKIFEQKNITLNVGAVVRVDPALQVGAVGETVSVEADALQVQADTNDVSQTITSNQITNLATNGRNVLQLTALVPGASSNMPDFDSPGAQFQNRSIYFNGMRQDANNWIIDGGEAYDRGGGGILLVSPSQDGLQQFTITTSNYAADLGNSSGGMVSMAIKNGTKRFHGGAWEYNRNDATSAWSYFLKQTKLANPSTRKAELRYNTFGFNLGGPVEFRSAQPKTFFFYNQEWRRLINGGAIHNQVPSAAMFGFGSSGTTVTNAPDMNGMGVNIYVPQTTDTAAIARFAAVGLKPGDQFPNNVIPLSLVDPTAKAYLAAGYMLPPNDSTGKFYNSGANTNTFYREEMARVDHQFNEKFTVFGHLIYDSLTQQAPIVAWTGNTYPTIGSLETVPSWAAVLHTTYAIRPNLLNEAAFNENGNNILITNTGNWHKPAGFNNSPLFDSNTINKVPGIFISGGNYGANMDNGNWPWSNTWRSNQFKDDLSWIKGVHNMKFGFAWLQGHKNQMIFTNTAGQYRYNGNATAGGGTNGVGLADFLLGYANSFAQAQTQDSVSITFNTLDAYVMDDWRLNKRVTLNLGVR